MKDLSKVRTIIEAVSSKTGISIADIVSESRKAHIVRARHMVMWICRWYTAATLQTIAYALNCKRHATAIHGATQIDNLCYTNRAFDADIRIFVKTINLA
jgi:chromosomal replication initiator protein